MGWTQTAFRLHESSEPRTWLDPFAAVAEPARVMITHRLPFGASISNAMFAFLKRMAAEGRNQQPEMLPSIRWVERGGDAMAGLRPTSEGRLSFDAEPVNRLAADAAQVTGAEWVWAVFLLERRFAHNVFGLGDFTIEIGEEAQARLQGRVLDWVDGEIITVPSG